MLDGDAAAENFDTLQIAVADGLAVIEERNQRRSCKGTSRFTRSKTSRKREMLSS
jgi:hypothetical protein